MADRDEPQIDARTSNQIAGMSDQARSELAQQLNKASSSSSYDSTPSYRRGDGPVRRDPIPRDRDRRYRSGDADSDELASASASLHRTERRLKVNGDQMATGRKVRLKSRAKRLKRQVNRLK